MAANIKAMMETLRAMEEMQKGVNRDINKDINKKRKEALQKIRAYLDDLAESLDGTQLSVEFPEGTVFQSHYRGQSIKFNYKYTISKSPINGYEYSEEPINWYIGCYDSTRKSDNNFYEYIDSTNNNETLREPGYWADGFIKLIENWSEIKSLIEKGVEEELTQRMEIIRKNTANRIKSYEAVNEFEA